MTIFICTRHLPAAVEDLLEKSGFTRNQAKVYLVLLASGISPAKNIIRKTGLHRQLVYDALEGLARDGLVGFVVQANRRYFRAADPKAILNILAQRTAAIAQQEAEVKNALPSLEALRSSGKETQEAVAYEGNRGIKSLLEDMLDQEGEISTIGASDTTAPSLRYHLKFNLPKFHEQRERLRIQHKILFSEEMRNRAKLIDKLKNAQARVLPKAFTANSSTNIYGDKVSLIMWGEEPFGILIKSKDIALAQRKHFDILWNLAKKP